MKQIPKVYFHKVKIEGDLTVFDHETRQVIRGLIDDPLPLPFVEIDLSNTGFVDSSGIELLYKLNKNLRKRNGLLRITNAAPNVKDVLDICGVATLLDVDLVK